MGWPILLDPEAEGAGQSSSARLSDIMEMQAHNVESVGNCQQVGKTCHSIAKLYRILYETRGI